MFKSRWLPQFIGLQISLGIHLVFIYLLSRASVLPVPHLVGPYSVSLIARQGGVKVTKSQSPKQAASPVSTGDSEVSALPIQSSTQMGSNDGCGAENCTPGYELGSSDNPAPPYPFQARSLGWQGLVKLAVVVSENGFPTSLNLTHSSGHEILDRAASHAVAKWKFKPASRSGINSPGTVVVTIEFRLTDIN